MTGDLSPLERTLEQVVEDHLGDYASVEAVKREPGDPLEFRDLIDGNTFLVEVRAMPTGG